MLVATTTQPSATRASNRPFRATAVKGSPTCGGQRGGSMWRDQRMKAGKAWARCQHLLAVEICLSKFGAAQICGTTCCCLTCISSKQSSAEILAPLPSCALPMAAAASPTAAPVPLLLAPPLLLARMSCSVSQFRIKARAAWRRMLALAAASAAECSVALRLFLSRIILQQTGSAGSLVQPR